MFCWKHTRSQKIAATFLITVSLTLILPLQRVAADTVDDYPEQWRSKPMDTTYDSWREWNRECVSFAAFRLSARNGFEIPFHGDAGKWADSAANLHYLVNTTPAIGAVAWTSTHVAWVQAVSGSNVTVEEYNNVDSNKDGTFGNDGTYSSRTVDKTKFSKFIHFKDILPPGAASQPTNTLFFIKTRNTDTGRVELHARTADTGYSRGIDVATGFSSIDADNGTFQVVGRDLYFIKTRHTDSGRVEVHKATAAGNYAIESSYVSAFSASEDANGVFQMSNTNSDGIPDLVFIKTAHTDSGRIEYFSVDGASGYKIFTASVATAFGLVDAANGTFQAVGADLTFIKQRNTQSGRIEYFKLLASSDYKGFDIATSTAFGLVDADNGVWSDEDLNADGKPDLSFIKVRNTDSQRVEVHIAKSNYTYQTVTDSNATSISTIDANNGFWQINSKM